jgi:dihydroorotate dehydrogenase (NAD+) catalytic subunit
VDLPIIGMGGIMTHEDALEFILAGASAVAVGTANFVNPRATLDIIRDLETFLTQEGIGSVKELVGQVRVA